MGSSISVPIYTIQRDSQYYSSPNEFKPERFDKEFGGIKAFREKGVFFPFGEGPRICLGWEIISLHSLIINLKYFSGMKFALTQIKAGIAEIINNFEVSVNKRTQEPLILDNKEFISAPIGGIWINCKQLEVNK